MAACGREIFRTPFFIGISLLVLLAGSARADISICPGITLSESILPPLSATELDLVCGTREGPWSRIPPNQAKFHLSRFLQDRGHLSPEFRRVTSAEGISGWQVHPGPVAKVSGVRFGGLPPGEKSEQPGAYTFPKSESDAWVGKTLTPARLDLIEGTTSRLLRENGYPCAVAKTNVPDPGAREVEVSVDPGPYSTLDPEKIRVATDFPVEGHKRALARHYAFESGQPFDLRLLELTGRRLEASGYLDNAYFLTDCGSGSGAPAYTLRGSASPPRLLKAEFGFNTEEIAVSRLSWIHSRLGSQAAEAEVFAQASFIRQEVGAVLRSFPFKNSSRSSLKSDLKVFHLNEEPFETVGLEAGLSAGQDFDTRSWRMEFGAGPTFSWTSTVEDGARRNTFQTFLNARVGLIGHFYEYYAANPLMGTFASAETLISDTSVLSDLTIRRLRISAQHLWYYGRQSDPSSVFGIRAGAGVLGGDSAIPADFLFFLGGSENLRGFGRAGLPADRQGARSMLHAGQEVRFPAAIGLDLKPVLFKVEPIFFLDAGLLGESSFSLDGPVYFSPGVGFRGVTPLLPIRVTFARGYSVSSADGVSLLNPFQFFLGLGEEF